jgi:anti-sigma B factor antagonist
MLNQADTSKSRHPGSKATISQRELDERTNVIAIKGDLDLFEAPNLKWALVDLLNAGYSQVVIDLSQVTFMDSTAVGVLVGVNRSLDAGARLAIVCDKPNVLKIFGVSGLDAMFEIFPTLDEAVAYAQGTQ